MQGTLYRAAERDGYFGRGSYWTMSKDFALYFGRWARTQTVVPRLQRTGLWLWSIDVDEPDERVLDLRPPEALLFLDSETVNAQVERFAAGGLRWVLFHEGVFEGRVSTQAVYVGDEPLVPQALRALDEAAEHVL